MKISIDIFDPESISNGIKAVKGVGTKCQKEMEKLVADVAAYGEEQAKAELDSWVYSRPTDWQTGALKAGVKHTVDGLMADITSTADYSIYVEYGTGIMGAINSVSPDAPSWWKPGESEYTWYFPGDNGKAVFTVGQVSKPFMYHAYVKVRDYAEQRLAEMNL